MVVAWSADAPPPSDRVWYKSRAMTSLCPDCGGEWNFDEHPDACPHCNLATADLESAGAFLDEIMPQPKCVECGGGLTDVGMRQRIRTGHCSRHGIVEAVDRFRP